MTDGLQVRRAEVADRDAWDAFVAAHPAGDQLQAWGWGQVAAPWGERPVRLLATERHAVVGVAQILVRRAPFGRSILYIPHGPLWADGGLPADDPSVGAIATPGDPIRTPGGDRPAATLDALLAEVRQVGVEERGIVAKLDPRAGCPDAAGLIDAMLVTRGLRRARADLQARTTRILDLRLAPERLRATFDKDTRNLVRRAAREGVRPEVVRGVDPVAFGEFAALLATTGSRAGFRVRGEEALRRIAVEFAPAGGTHLVLARLDGRAIAGCLALSVGRRAFYLYAASLRDHELRHAHGAYAALDALCDALAGSGIETLDLWGVAEPDDPSGDPAWAGFSLFKRGFGGTRLRHPGTFDMVLSPLLYAARDVRERLGRTRGR